MINKKFGLVIAAGILSLAACGQEEQPSATEDAEVNVTEKESASEEEAVPEEEPASEEEPTPEEEAVAEDPAPEEKAVEENALEASSGEASELLSKGDAATFVFDKTGEFSIYCQPHPVMKMTVLVEEGAEQSGEVALDIADYEFSEETITVAPGTTIKWTNQDQAQHNVAFE